jgi:hypothetical protein
MVMMDYNTKTEMMVSDTQKNVMRNGMAASSGWNGQKWIPDISDNDGLWTSMYGAGELMRYASLKKAKASQEAIIKARSSALKSLKAVLMISNVAGRDGTVQARIRRYNSSRQEPFLSKEYVKVGGDASIRNYPGSLAAGVGMFGEGAGKIVDGAYEGGS